jgi:hypothetical protein
MEHHPRQRWELWRLDDNGNRLLIRDFADRSAAEKELAHFEALHHKQTYWLEQPGAPGESPPGRN